MGKFNFAETVEKIQKSFNKDQHRASQFGLGNSLESVSNDPKDYVVLPDWFKTYFGVMGLPFGKWIEISGRADAGKTSLALLAIRSAQEQGYGVIYIETEGKSSEQDLLAFGIDPNGVIAVRTNITEELFENTNRAIDSFFDNYPDEKLLLVIDSFGNTSSMRDASIDFTEQNAKVGGHAQINRLGLSSINARMNKKPIACLLVNYSYANIGSVGETNAGGRALELFSMLIIQASRKAWYERTVGGKKVRAGADVLWKTVKNHFVKALQDEDGNPILLPKEVVLRISAEGIRPLEKGAKDSEGSSDD